MSINAVSIAWVFSVIFFALAILGFFMDSLPIDKDFLKTNIVLNITHLVTAIGFVIVAKIDVGALIQFVRVIGMSYMLISLIGFMGMNIVIGEQWEDVIYHNLLSYLQFGLGVILSIIGSILIKTHRSLFLY